MSCDPLNQINVNVPHHVSHSNVDSHHCGTVSFGFSCLFILVSPYVRTRAIGHSSEEEESASHELSLRLDTSETHVTSCKTTNARSIRRRRHHHQQASIASEVSSMSGMCRKQHHNARLRTRPAGVLMIDHDEREQWGAVAVHLPRSVANKITRATSKTTPATPSPQT